MPGVAFFKLRATQPVAVAFVCGAASAVAVFVWLVIANRELLTGPFFPFGDYASDMLQVRHPPHGWPLHGHYNYMGGYHPGPYFLYLHMLGERLAGGVAGSLFGAHLVGIFANAAGFAGLLTALIHLLARRVGAENPVAVAAALIGLGAALTYLTFAIGHPWVPSALLLPFLTFLVSVLLLMEGSAVGLVAATFCTAVLVHLYIPMPLIAGPVWMTALILGWRRRRAATGRGFSRATWLGVAAIILLFALPMIIDAVLDPPGNTVNIVREALGRQTGPALFRPPTTRPDLLSVVATLTAPWRVIGLGAWLVSAVGLGAAVINRQFRALWLRAGVLVAVVSATSVLTLLMVSQPMRHYWGWYFMAVPAFLAVIAAMTLIIAGVKRAGQRGPAGAFLLALASPAVVTLTIPHFDRPPLEPNFSPPGQALVSNPRISTVVDLLAGDMGADSRVELEGDEERAPRGIIVGILLELDRRGVRSCIRRPDLTVVVTPTLICKDSAGTEAGVRAFQIERVLPCSDAPPPPMLPVGGRASVFFNHAIDKTGREVDVCLAVTRIGA